MSVADLRETIRYRIRCAILAPSSEQEEHWLNKALAALDDFFSREILLADVGSVAAIREAWTWKPRSLEVQLMTAQVTSEGWYEEAFRLAKEGAVVQLMRGEEHIGTLGIPTLDPRELDGYGAVQTLLAAIDTRDAEIARLRATDVDPEDKSWFDRMLEEVERDVWRGLDHSLDCAPIRIKLAKIAFDRLVRTTKRFAAVARIYREERDAAIARVSKI